MKLIDPKCFELATYFLRDVRLPTGAEPIGRSEQQDLAENIQDTIERYISMIVEEAQDILKSEGSETHGA